MKREAVVALLTVMGVYLVLVGVGPEHTHAIQSWSALGGAAACFGVAWTIIRRGLQ